MAAYAALLSLFQTLNHIKIHPRPPISLDQNQVDSLSQYLTFFQDFLERYPNCDSLEDDKLEWCIMTASYAAEDAIDTHIVDRIDHVRSTSENISSADLYGDLEKVIHHMDLIKKEVMESIQKKIMRAQHLDMQRISGPPASTRQSSNKPVFDDAIVNKVLDKLTGQQSSLQIIPIVGMGGIGKTTFARYIFQNPLIVEYFDTLTWVKISQEYIRRNILEVLFRGVEGRSKGLSELSEDEIGIILYQHLYGRRYLIVMDDIWSVEAWYKIKFFFPDNNNGSRIMITTRLSNLAFKLSGSHTFHMPFLDENKSWNLLCETVFGEVNCPIELENIGKKIARKCRGLPLSIGVTGGLLRKSNMTQAYWMYALENLNMLINLEDNEYALQILRTSYKELPMHLKPLFLYMGIFPEDDLINISMLVKLWIAEGILKPIENKSLEEVAKNYLKELVDRNLILIPELRWDGEARLCKIHDLLRDVCLREAKKQKLFCVLKVQKHHTPQGMDMERRIFIHLESKDATFSPQFLQGVESASRARSLLYKMGAYYPHRVDTSPSLGLRLLRVCSPVDKYGSSITYSRNAILKQANLRHLYVELNFGNVISRSFPLSSHFWNLQTLVVKDSNLYSARDPINASAIWQTPLLRHFKLFNFVVLDPPDVEDGFILKNLQTLSGIMNFKCSEEVVKRIPNIRKLKLIYQRDGLHLEDQYCLNNLGHLRNLESLNLEVYVLCYFVIKVRKSMVSFPHSLKKLSLMGTQLSWEDMTTTIGSLPLLQFLKLRGDACVGPKWETVEGNFCSLRVLEILFSDLIYWEMESTHFPRLETLRLVDITELKEIPLSVGDITTFKSIWLDYCSKFVEDSANRIKKEQEENGNEDLQVVIERSSRTR